MVLAAVAAAVVSITACGANSGVKQTESIQTADEKQNVPETKDSDADSGKTRVFVDSAGRSVEVPANITRVIPSGDMAQMFIWPLAADKLVSVSSALTDEQMKYLGTECAGLPETGNLYKTGSELNIEEVASLDAQIIIDFGEAKDTIKEDLDNLQELLGIPCVFIEGGLEDSAESYRMLGELFGMQQEAEPLADYIDNIVNTTNEVFNTTEKKNGVVLNGSDGLGCVASGTYFDEIWAYMLNNVAVVEEGQMYAATNINFEQLAAWNPEYLFFYNGTEAETFVNEASWSQLSAVAQDKYYSVPSGPYDFVSPPTVNRYLAIVWLSEIMYPDDFSWDAKALTQEYYDLFYHYDLSDEEYAQLTGLN